MTKRARTSSTPHRMSRSSNVLPSPGVHYPIQIDNTPLDQVLFPSIHELNDSMAQLDSNMQNLQDVHESLISFNESFGSFLYGLQINAYTVEFNELPSVNDVNAHTHKELKEKIARLEEYFDSKKAERQIYQSGDNETYMTNDEDGSFLVQPKVASTKPVSDGVSEKGKVRSKIPVGRRMTTTGQTGRTEGGVMRPTSASERRQRAVVQKDKRPPFR